MVLLLHMLYSKIYVVYVEQLWLSIYSKMDTIGELVLYGVLTQYFKYIAIHQLNVFTSADTDTWSTPQSGIIFN